MLIDDLETMLVDFFSNKLRLEVFGLSVDAFDFLDDLEAFWLGDLDVTNLELDFLDFEVLTEVFEGLMVDLEDSNVLL